MPERGRTYECFVGFGMCKVIDYYCIIVKKGKTKRAQTARLYKIDGLDSEADEGAGIDLGRRKIIADPPFVC